MSTKIKIICGIIPLIIGPIFWFGCNFAPGSYPYAQEYELDCPEEKVISAIKTFKQEFPEYIVPRVSVDGQGSWDLIDEPTKDPAFWHKFYFYYKSENQIIFTWTRSTEYNKTTFAFVSINDGLNLGNWKNINKDLNHEENEKAKKMFEEKILSKIKEKL